MDTKAEQFYPTYKAKKRDILLLEFEEAQKIANGQNKVYGQVTNILLASITFAFTFYIGVDSSQSDKFLIPFLSSSIIFPSVLFVFGAILLRYFVDLQKQITINARKVVTLRTLLGLDYGHIHLTLPNWRAEGATNPFVLKFFHGWLNFKTMPFWLITITVNIIWWITTNQKEDISFSILNYNLQIDWIWGNILITLIYFVIFRINLYDRHETLLLNAIELLCKLIRITLVDNFEYILYRAKLSYIELERLNVNYKKLNNILVDIEDNTFFSNIGISFKALARGALSRFKFFRKKLKIIENGGSTITMQLSRSLFIPSNQNKYFRKFTEILLCFWLNGQFSKKELLNLYIASVRYERGVLGLSDAIKYFFGEIKEKELSSEESFFLVERLSNITSTVNWSRINLLISKTNATINMVTLKRIYQEQQRNGRLK